MQAHFDITRPRHRSEGPSRAVKLCGGADLAHLTRNKRSDIRITCLWLIHIVYIMHSFC